ncbi:sensor histidine kinase [Streptomyces sp. NPDC088762]|uniref:sensor histidine kinase n=1 Tax=Streptomyces sp. NPDC088762 TaxID=3365891 RepID=UPI0038011AFC
MKVLTGWVQGHRPWSTTAKVTVAAVLLGLTALDAVLLEHLPSARAGLVVGCAVIVCVCAVPVERVSLTVRATVAAAVSWTVTLILITDDDPVPVVGVGEIAGLLLLLASVLWRGSTRAALVLGPALAVACVAVPARDADPHEWTLAFSLVTGVVAAFSLLLRAQSEQRVRDLDALRSAERRALARELHDVVAHHVTGIVVQTKGARFARLDARAADAVLESIGREAEEALSAMRRLVTVMRRAEPASGASRAPASGIREVREMAAAFASDDRAVEVAIEPGLEARLPADVAAGIHRLTREALTNIRKHAADATRVCIALSSAPGALELSVTDNGRNGAALPERARGGGFGIEGMKERAAAMGGRLEAGPLPSGGWQVRAHLPLTDDVGAARTS